MGTTNDPRGRLTELYAATQAALATAVASPDVDFVRRHYYEMQPSPASEPQDDEIMGGGFDNAIDARPAAPDLERASARIVWPLDLVQIGFVLAEILGDPVTTGSSAPYTHTFSSGTAVLPIRTVERKFASGAFDGVVGLVGRSIQFPIGADRGYTRVSADYTARQILDQYSSSVAGTPEAVALSARVPRKVGTIKRDGSALGSIISGDATITNVLGEDNYHGSGLIDDVQLEGRTLALNLVGRFKGAALRDLGKVQVGAYLPGVQDIELAWELSASLKLVLTIRNVRFAKTAPGTAGPGRMDVPLRGRAEVGASAAMVTAVLTNSRDGYA